MSHSSFMATRGRGPARRRLATTTLLLMVACVDNAHFPNDAGSDAPSEVAEAPPEVAPEVAPEALPEAAPEAAREAAVDLVPDAAALFRMRATLVGRTDHGGTEVKLAGIDRTAMTDPTGDFEVPGLPDGTYAVSLRNGAYEEEIPALIVRGGAPFVQYASGGAERPFPTVELPRAHRIYGGDNFFSSIVVSPDQTRVLVWTLRSPTTVSLLDGEGRNPMPLAMGAVGALDFLDDNTIFFGRAPQGFDAPGDLVTMPVTGGPEKVWFSSVAATAAPQLFLGRTRVRFVRLVQPPPNPDFRSVLADSNGQTLGELGRNIGDPRISPDGFWFAFSTQTGTSFGGPRDLRLTDLRSGQTRVVAPNFEAGGDDFAFTPDSQYFVYGRGQIFSIKVDSGVRTTLGDAESLVMSPDGRFVLLRGRHDDPLKVVPVTGGPGLTIPSGPSGASHTLHRFSSDGRYVFPRASPAMAVTTDTGVERLISDALEVAITGYVEATQTVYFTARRQAGGATFNRLTLATPGDAEPLTARLDATGNSPTQRHLFYSERAQSGAEPPALTIVNLKSGTTRVFKPGAGRPIFSPDESRVVFFDGNQQVRVGNLVDGTAVTVGTAMNPYLENLGFSPDGSRVIFADSSVVAVAPSDGSAPAVIFAEQIGGIALRWKGNRHIIFGMSRFPDRPAFVEGTYLAPEP